MIAQRDIDPLVESLAEVLDGEMEMLRTRRRQLEELAPVLVRNDRLRLEALLAEMDQAERSQESVDRRLLAAQRELGKALCRPVERMPLSELIQRLPVRHRQTLQDRQAGIVELAESVRRQHLQVSLLLTECARVNRLLLAAVFPDTPAVTVYGCGGPLHWRPNVGLLDTES